MEDKSCKTPRWRILKSQLNNISIVDFNKRIKTEEDIIIVDVRTVSEFESGHIEGAINISYLADDFWDKTEQLDNSKLIFVYCRTGRRSIRACTLMKNGGFDNQRVFNMDGGYEDYLELQTS